MSIQGVLDGLLHDPGAAAHTQVHLTSSSATQKTEQELGKDKKDALGR